MGSWCRYCSIPMGLAATNSGAVASSSGSAANAIQPGNGYAYHTFTSPGSINFTTGGEIEVLIVAAGGGGADSGSCCIGTWWWWSRWNSSRCIYNFFRNIPCHCRTRAEW